MYAPNAVPGVGRARDDVDAARPVAAEVQHGVRQELVLGRGGLRAEGGDDGRSRGAVLDRHPHAGALPGLGKHLKNKTTKQNIKKLDPSHRKVQSFDWIFGLDGVGFSEGGGGILSLFPSFFFFIFVAPNTDRFEW